jgi:beta-lactamase class A
MRRAMQMSDNTCNDKLLRLVGGPQAVRDVHRAQAAGHDPLRPGREMLQAGTAGLEWKPEYSMGNAFAVARSKLAPARAARGVRGLCRRSARRRGAGRRSPARWRG